MKLIEMAKDSLSRLEVIEIVEFPLWMVLIVSFSVAIYVSSMYIVLHKKKKIPIRLPHLHLRHIFRPKGMSKEAMNKEKERLTRVLRMLEKERKEGIISQGAYNEMRKGAEDKLAIIEKKLEKS